MFLALSRLVISIETPGAPFNPPDDTYTCCVVTVVVTVAVTAVVTVVGTVVVTVVVTVLLLSYGMRWYMTKNLGGKSPPNLSTLANNEDEADRQSHDDFQYQACS